MIIRWFYDEKLAQASYLIGCAASGEAIVIDPPRRVEPILQVAQEQGLRIVAVTETHIHADFVSGTRELSAATGATMYLSDEGDELWKYRFADDPRAVLIKDGHVIRIGNLSLRAIHTPGHTPEHIAFLLTDHAMSETPHSLFSGDFVFVGDVGRPDLLERAANFAGTMEKGARLLFRSLQKLQDLPDSLLIWPAHGAGSACGKSLGGSPVTTLGYERQTNWAFRIRDEDKFVDEVLSGQPEPPVYFKEMKRINKEGPRVLGKISPTRRLSAEELRSFSGMLVDVRRAEAIREGSPRGVLAIPSGLGLTNWSGWLLPYDHEVVLIAESQAQADQARQDMASIGLDVVAGWVRLEDTRMDPEPMETIECSQLKGNEFLLDVRGINEWRLQRRPDSHHIPLGYLRNRLEEVPRDRPVVVYCASGGRSPIAVSLLKQAGFTQVRELVGGIQEMSQRCPQTLVTA